jgi:formate dehydrogenase subunit gamma
MRAWRTRWRTAVGIWLTLLLTGIAPAWATSHELPPLAELPLIQPGPGWQEFVNYHEALRWFGGVALGLMVLFLMVHFAFYGAHHVRPSGRMVKRYTAKEVVLHALLALAFAGAWASSTYLILAKYVLGYGERQLTVPLGRVSSTVHITAGLIFLGALVVLALIWRHWMRFAPYDPEWLKELGGYFSRRHRILPAGRFNAGQKIWFCVSIVMGVLVAASGALIYYRGLLGVRWDIVLYIAHTALAAALSAAVVGHVYFAVLVHPRSVRATITGEIDEACLREDHPLEPLSRSQG